MFVITVFITEVVVKEFVLTEFVITKFHCKAFPIVNHRRLCFAHILRMQIKRQLLVVRGHSNNM